MPKSPVMTVKLTLDMKKFNKGISVAQTKMKSFGKSAVSAGKSLSLGATLPILGLGAAMIKLASDATETNNKFNEIFGKAAKKTGKVLDNLADDIGRDSVALKDFGGNLGGVLTSIGFTDKAAGKLSTSIIKLGIDVGSFRNKSDDQVINAFTSALVGEREALKSLGAQMLDADVNLEAFRMTGKRTSKELTKQDKALATVSLLYKLFRKDVGDAKRTQKEFANQLKELSANIKKVGRAFGDELKPLANELLLIINPMIKNFSNLSKETKRNILITAGLVGAIGPLLVSIGLLSQAVAFGLGGYVSMAKGISVVIAKMVAWNAVSKTVTATTNTQTVAQKLLGASTSTTTTKIVKQSRVMLGFTKVSGVLITALSSVQASIVSLSFANIITGLKATSVAATGLIKRLLLISIPVAAVVVALALVVNAGLSVARNWELIKVSAIDAWNGVLSAVSDAVKEVKKWVVDKTKPIIDFFIGAWDVMANVVSKAWNSVVKSIGGAVKKIVDWIKNKIVKQINVMIDGYNTVAKLFGGTPLKPFADFKELVDTTTDAYKTVVMKTKKFAGDVAENVKLIGDGIKEAEPFKIFVDETKKNMDLAKSIFDDTIKKMTGFSFSFGGPAGPGVSTPGPSQNPPTVPGAGNKDKPEEQIAGAKTGLQDFVTESQNFSKQFDDMWTNTFQNFSSGFGGAIGTALVEGQNLGDTMKSLMDDMVKGIISSLVKMAAQWVISAAIGGAASHAQSSTAVANNSIVAGSGAAASQASIPIIGPVLALAAMAAMIATVGALSGDLKLAKGGITKGPTNALIGEAGPEAVIPLSRLDSMIGGGGGEQTLIIELDGRKLMEALIPHQPSVVRYNVGVNY